MARPRRTHPKAFLECRNDSYRIRWKTGDKRYAISVGAIPEAEAESLTILATAALSGRIDWPPELATAQAVTLYTMDREGLAPANTEDNALVAAYINHMRVNSDSTWPNTVSYMLRKALGVIGTLKNATTAQLSAYLDQVRENHKAATRNRTKYAISGFYTWLRETGVHPATHKPLNGIKLLPEERPEEGIITWEGADISALLAAADHYRDGIAVWIAVYAGLRRSEIAHLLWTDITPAYITIRKSKTYKQRQIPLAKALDERLAREKREGPRVVPWPVKFNGWSQAADRLVKEYLPRELPLLHKKNKETFNWNPFRHTFASRHAQAGHSLDLIAAWLGDSPKVCRDHYARFVPKDRRDERIDLPDLPAPKPPRRAPAKAAPETRKGTAKRGGAVTGKRGAKKAEPAA